jgi:hypothetical protein
MLAKLRTAAIAIAFFITPLLVPETLVLERN